MNKNSCPFCSIDAARVLESTHYWQVIYDQFPLSDSHALIIPKRHVSSIFDLSRDEAAEMHEILSTARFTILKSAKTSDCLVEPDGFNIGVNDGAAAGQTIEHLHIHLIPRYFGDSTDPRGGVRWIFPDKAKYW